MFCSQFKVGLSAFFWYFTEKQNKTRGTKKSLCLLFDPNAWIGFLGCQGGVRELTGISSGSSWDAEFHIQRVGSNSTKTRNIPFNRGELKRWGSGWVRDERVYCCFLEEGISGSGGWCWESSRAVGFLGFVWDRGCSPELRG